MVAPAIALHIAYTWDPIPPYTFLGISSLLPSLGLAPLVWIPIHSQQHQDHICQLVHHSLYTIRYYNLLKKNSFLKVMHILNLNKPVFKYKDKVTARYQNQVTTPELEMLLIPNALCWSSQKFNCACTLPAEVQLRLRVTCRSWQKLFVGKNFVKILVTAQTQLRSHSEQQRAFGNSNICNWAILECFSINQLTWLSIWDSVSETF